MRYFVRTLALCAAALCLAPEAVGARQFSMDAILSAPFVGELVASPDGTAVAYVAHERGPRNIYFGTATSHARRVTSYAVDDGEDLFAPSILPNNRAIVYVRGEGPNGRGEYPNPISLRVPPRQEVWLVSSTGGAPVLVGEGHSPVVSPDGARVVWVRHGQPFVATIGTPGSRPTVSRPTRLFSIRGQVAEPAYSPDCSRIAFTNERGDHSFIVIYEMQSRRISYVTPNFAHDSSPAWSPDGKRLAFIREPGAFENEDPYQDPIREPWSVWVADAHDANARQIWRADPGMGSEYYRTDSAAQLLWSNAGELAFPWEKDGWRHLYAVSADGGAARLLTPGRFETETVIASVDRSRLIYTSNQRDIDLRHVWSVPFRGGAPVQLTQGPHSQWGPASLRGGLAFIDADYNHPPSVFIRGSTTRPFGGVVVPSNFPAASLVNPQLVTFYAPDGLEIHAQLFVPQRDAGKHCAIIFDHGGSRRQMLPGFHYMEAYTNLYESNQYYVNRGCVLLSINYRSGIMYGHDFRKPKNYGARGGSEYQDVLAGATYLQNRSDVDSSRIGIYGLSYGGYLTALALGRNSDIFKAGVDMAGVHNWATLMDADYGRAVGTPEERRVAELASPISTVNTWRSPVFMSQGDDDRNVIFSQGVDLSARLRAKGVEVTEMVFPNETHENRTFEHMLRLYETSANWLLGKLGAP